jgi:hypothetical protein
MASGAEMKSIVCLVLLLTSAVAQAEHCELAPVLDLPVSMVGYAPVMAAKVNGIEAPFIIDSGSVFHQLSWDAAKRFNLPLETSPAIFQIEGQQTSVYMATVHEFTFGGHIQHNKQFLVGVNVYGKSIAGVVALAVSPLEDVDYNLAKGSIRVMRPHDCKDADMAYWAGATPHSIVTIDEVTSNLQLQPRAEALINGMPIRVMFSTGTTASMLTKKAAERLGVTPQSPGTVEVEYEIGRNGVRTGRVWMATFSSFRIGAEEIQNARLRIADIDLLDCDMLLGADFFQSHHVYVATHQRKLYFTYTGGPVFKRNVAPQSPVPDGGAPTPPDSPTQALPEAASDTKP